VSDKKVREVDVAGDEQPFEKFNSGPGVQVERKRIDPIMTFSPIHRTEEGRYVKAVKSGRTMFFGEGGTKPLHRSTGRRRMSQA